MREVFEKQADNWRLELVRLRRKQAAQLFSLSDRLTEWSRESGRSLEAQQALSLFAEMRRMIATTQTEWPLSLINDEESLDAYSVASRRAIASSEAFFSFMRQLLGPE